MCGIAGIVNFDGRNILPENIKRMTSSMQHRGPDDEGHVLFSSKLAAPPPIQFKRIEEVTGIPYQVNIALGHRRLSILDLTVAE